MTLWAKVILPKIEKNSILTHGHFLFFISYQGCFDIHVFGKIPDHIFCEWAVTCIYQYYIDCMVLQMTQNYKNSILNRNQGIIIIFSYLYTFFFCGSAVIYQWYIDGMVSQMTLQVFVGHSCKTQFWPIIMLSYLYHFFPVDQLLFTNLMYDAPNA